jgi:hypothetical protein
MSISQLKKKKKVRQRIEKTNVLTYFPKHYAAELLSLLLQMRAFLS